MKKILLVAALIGLGSVGIFWFYQANQKPPVDPWRLVPRQALMVYEGSSPRRFDSLFSTPQSQVLLRLSATVSQNTTTQLHAFQQAGTKTESILIFQLGPGRMDSLRVRFSGGKKRIYEGIKIHSIKELASEFVFCEIENYGVISTNSLLVEEAIRQYKDEVPTFKHENSWLFSVPALKKDAGNVYVNWPSLAQVLEKNQLLITPSSSLPHLAGTSVFDVKLTPQSVLFSGFGTDSVANKLSMLSLFRRQSPVSLRLLGQVPDQFDLLTHFGISDPSVYNEDRQRLAASDTAWLRFEKSFSQDPIQANEFWNQVDQEVVQLKDQSNEAVFVRVHQITKMQAFLQRLQRHRELVPHHRIESFSTFSIHTFARAGFGQYLLWPLMSYSTQLHLALVNEILVASSDEKFLKEMITALDNDNTIGKSLAWRSFLNNTQSESNLTLLFSALHRSETNEGSLQGRLMLADKGSLQFTRIDQHFYASSFFSLPKRSATRVSISGTGGVAAPTSDLYPVINFTNENSEVIFQDQSGKLNLWDGKKVMWTVPLEGNLIAVNQIDYLKNKKLQYLCATPSRLYLIDRLGNMVDGFPVSLPVADVQYFKVVDYNNTKDYRLAAARATGEVWLLDKKGKPLPGWTPRKTGIQLAGSLEFFRLNQRDFFMAVDVDGHVHAFNRKGEPQPGFPFTARTPIGGPLTSDQAALLMITQDGRLIRVNNQGRAVSEEIFLKNDNAARFSMLKELSGNGALVARIERGKIAIFDSLGQQLCEVSNPLSDQVVLSYRNFGRGSEVIVAYDREQQLFFAIDRAGKMLVPQPLESLRHPAISYDRKRQVLEIAHYAGNNLLSIDVPF